MSNLSQKKQVKENKAGRLFVGILIGSLIGAGAMLFVAPQPGRRTRAQVRQKSLELKDQANEAIEDVTAQAAAKARQINKQARKLEHRGQAILAEKKKQASSLFEAAKSAFDESAN